MEGTVKYSYRGVSRQSVGLWLCLIPAGKATKSRMTSVILDYLKIGRDHSNLNKRKTFK
jgi:hypothetical protein